MNQSDKIPMPSSNVSSPSDVMYWNNATKKTITIYNNTEETVYPILEGENSGRDNNGKMYDPHETSLTPGNKGGMNEEYRAYVGYKGEDGKNYLGLRRHTSITIPVPMAIWDSGRLNLVTKVSPVTTDNNLPFTYHGAAKDSPPQNLYPLQEHLPDPRRFVQPIDDNGGLLLLYHAPLAEGMVNDAPSQFIEFSIRDKDEQPGQETSFDYDLSYLDHMFIPVALEAVGGDDPFNPKNKGYQAGYVGTTMSVRDLRQAMGDFAKQTNNSVLGGYFGGKGWPQIYLSKPLDGVTPNPSDPVKLPGGYNVFALSVASSSYDVLQNMLTSSAQHNPVPASPADAPNYAVKTITNLWFSWAKYWLALPENSSLGGWPSALSKLLADVTFRAIEPADAGRAKKFAEKVYNVLRGVSTSFSNQNLAASTAQELIGYILGWTVPDGFKNRTREIDDLYQHDFKSVIRGVADYEDPNTNGNWYPSPNNVSDAIYNLNPWVWFVHKHLPGKIYAYAFSVDDDYGNILIPGAESLVVAIGGSKGLPNQSAFQPGGKKSK